MQASPVGGSEAAHLYVFYVSWRLLEAHCSWGVQIPTILSYRVGPLKKDLTRAGGGEEFGRLWEAQSIVFYVSGTLCTRAGGGESGRLWEAQSVVSYGAGRLCEVQSMVIYMPRRLQGVPLLTNLSPRVGPLKKDLTRERRLGSAGKLNHTYFTCMGGSGSRIYT